MADTTDKKVTYVNDILVEEKLAIKADEVNKNHISFVNKRDAIIFQIAEMRAKNTK